MPISAGAQENRVTVAVLARTLAEPFHDLRLGQLARNAQIAVEAVLGGNRRKQFVDRTSSNRLEHGFAVGWRLGKVAHDLAFRSLGLSSWLRRSTLWLLAAGQELTARSFFLPK